MISSILIEKLRNRFSKIAINDFQLKRPLECIEWCDRGLATNPEDKVLSQLRIESADLQKTLERDERKKAALEKKQKKEEQVRGNTFHSKMI